MVDSSKGISVGCTENRVFIRIVGRGTFQNSQPLRRVAMEMIERGYNEFSVDLAQCQGMDSTFLGVLAGIGLRLRQGKLGAIHVVNISSRNLELLQTLGLDRLFHVSDGGEDAKNHPTPAEAKFEKLPDSDIGDISHPLNKGETADLMLEAHENLIRVDDKNKPKFRDLKKFLRENVERREREGEQ